LLKNRLGLPQSTGPFLLNHPPSLIQAKRALIDHFPINIQSFRLGFP